MERFVRLLQLGNTTGNATAGNDQSAGGEAVTDLISRHIGNPLPAPLDGALGAFLLNVVAWVVIAALVALLLNPVVKSLTRNTKTQIDDHIVRIVTVPIFVLIVAFGTLQSLLAFDLAPWVVRSLDQAWTVLLFLTLTLIVYRVWNEVIRAVAKNVTAKTTSQLDDKLYPLFENLGGFVIIFVGIWFTVRSFGVDMTLFAAGAGIGGLVIAFAAQDTLANLFAGVFIILDQPFREGDRIEIQEIDTWGDVVDVGLRTTRIRTRDNRMVIVPNNVIGSNPVVNHSFPDTSYRLGVDVGIAYGSDIDRATEVLMDAVRGVEGVLQDKRIEVLFRGFGDSSLDFHCRAWFPHFMDARRYEDKLNRAIDKALRAADIEIPFPQRVIHMAPNP